LLRKIPFPACKPIGAVVESSLARLPGGTRGLAHGWEYTANSVPAGDLRSTVVGVFFRSIGLPVFAVFKRLWRANLAKISSGRIFSSNGGEY
jgi:hypothetical protein